MISLRELISDNYIGLSKHQIKHSSLRDFSTDHFTLGIESERAVLSSSWTVSKHLEVDGRDHLVCTRRCVDDSGMSVRRVLCAFCKSRKK